MYPRLLTLGPFHLFGHLIGPLYLYSYGLCMATALGLSIYLFARDAGKYIAPQVGQTYNQTFQKTFDLGVWVIISSILGARVFYVWENHVQFTNPNLLANIWDMCKIWEGGLVYYGGLFGALAAAAFWVRMEKWPVSYGFDLVSPYILLGQAIGRMGCFLNGCCYGVVDTRYGLVFPGGEDNLPHLPTQLWELAGDLALFFLLLWARKWTLRYRWLTLALYGFTYGLLRFVIEFWRLKRSSYLFNSVSQELSGILVIFSLVIIAFILSKGADRKPLEAK